MELFLAVLGAVAFALFKNVFPQKKKKLPNQELIKAYSERRDKFVDIVIDPEKLRQVKKIIFSGYMDSSVVENELKPVFDMFPELRGHEDKWHLDCRAEGVSNLGFTETILYLKYGCMPINYTIAFWLGGYLIDTRYDVCTYATFSEESRKKFMRWAEGCARSNGAYARLKYNSYSGKYEWDY